MRLGAHRMAPRAMVALLAAVATPSGAKGGIGPATAEVQLAIGHDSNLLDASDAERSAFSARDPESFFVVSSMRDQFLDGAIRGEWRLPRLSAGHPGLAFEYQRRQYLNNPIKSTERFTLESRLRPASHTRVNLATEFVPRFYSRHRLNPDAQPGEPQFSPEVYRRGDASAVLVQGVTAGVELEIGLEGSVRDYRAPFDARDRHLAGATMGLAGSLSPDFRLGARGGYRRTWSRNQPGIASDLSNREWIVAPWLAAHPRLVSIRLDVETSWRRYTSSDPKDDGHFGRKDLRSEVRLEIARQVAGSLSSVTRLVGRVQRSSLPLRGFDEDAFSDAEVETGLRWHREAPPGSPW